MLCGTLCLCISCCQINEWCQRESEWDAQPVRRKWQGLKCNSMLCLPVWFSELCSSVLPECSSLGFRFLWDPATLSSSVRMERFQRPALLHSSNTALQEKKWKDLFMSGIILGARFSSRDRLTSFPCKNQACLVLYPEFLEYKMTLSCHKLCICWCDHFLYTQFSEG